MNWRLINSVLTSALTVLVVFLLLSSFGLHSVQISHIHPGHQSHHETSHQGEQESNGAVVLGEYMHAAEKKLFLLIVSILLLGASAPFLLPSWTQFIFVTNLWYSSVLKRWRVLTLTANDYIKLSLARGILNPKLY